MEALFSNRDARSTHKTPLLSKWRFAFPRWSLASQQIKADGLSIVPIADSPGRSTLFLQGRSVADALTGRLLLCGLAGVLFQQPGTSLAPYK
jgi:hypothetical protein